MYKIWKINKTISKYGNVHSQFSMMSCITLFLGDAPDFVPNQHDQSHNSNVLSHDLQNVKFPYKLAQHQHITLYFLARLPWIPEFSKKVRSVLSCLLPTSLQILCIHSSINSEKLLPNVYMYCNLDSCQAYICKSALLLACRLTLPYMPVFVIQNHTKHLLSTTVREIILQYNITCHLLHQEVTFQEKIQKLTSLVNFYNKIIISANIMKILFIPPTLPSGPANPKPTTPSVCLNGL